MIAYGGNEANQRMNANTRQETQLTGVVVDVLKANEPSVSPDGRLMAFVTPVRSRCWGDTIILAITRRRRPIVMVSRRPTPTTLGRAWVCRGTPGILEMEKTDGLRR